MSDCILSGVFSRIAFLDATVRSLEKSAICANDLLFRVTCEFAKGGRSIYDGGIEATLVYDDERATHIYGTENDLWMEA